MRQTLTLCLVLLAALTARAQDDGMTQLTSLQLGKTYKDVSIRRVSVHDPSIVPVTQADGTKKYYIFGSHRACAVTTDLKNWSNQSWTYGCRAAGGAVTATQGFAGIFNANPERTVRVVRDGVELSETFGSYDCEAWRYTDANPSLAGNQWAPDVIWNPQMNKWCMYMSLNGDDWRSVIALLTADQVTGPYVYQGPVVFSGFQWTGPDYHSTDLELVLGAQTTLPARYALERSWGNRWPNNIDPTVFFDADGQLWMAYGSWSGGIWAIRLDAQTGLRDYTVTYPSQNGNSNGVTSDPYFGKKIAGGYYVSGEGAYIEQIGKYYYLFVTHGGLKAMKGYEMHYYRATRPDGPYLDGSGASAIASRYEMNYGPSAPNTHGMKILGSHRWDNMALAEMSQGHNSLLQDEDGRAYLIYHTRFNSGNEGFEDRVHQLFTNAKGWLVASPYEFDGRSSASSQYTQGRVDTTEIVPADDIPGTYQLMLHPYKVDFAAGAYSAPVTVEFTGRGTITGDYVGTWRRTAGTSHITVKLRPRAGSTTSTEYSGVLLPQTVSGTNMPALCVTAIAANGVSLWASKADGMYAVDYCYSREFDFPFTSQQMVKADLDLAPATKKYGVSVTYTSSRPELLSDDGHLLVPYVASGDTTTSVQVTATISKDRHFARRTRYVRVRTNKADLQAVGITAPTADGRAAGDATTAPRTGRWHDLSGRPVRTPERGVYIDPRGRKVRVR